MSHIAYALSVWGAAQNSAMTRLNKLQKKGIRHVCNSTYNAHTSPLFKKEKILKIDDLYKFQCVKIMYKRLQNRLHHYHTSQLAMHHERQTISTRQRFDVQIGKQKNNSPRINAINYKIGTSWNELPLDAKMLAFKTLPTFTKRVRNIYISKYPITCNRPNCYSCKK